MPKVTARYSYTDEEGELLYQVERLEPKGFRARRPEKNEQGKTDWAYNLDGTRRVLYRLPAVLAAKARGDLIVVCEGEKDADRVTADGRVGTTMPGGAGKPFDEYVDSLAGAQVAIVADADAIGRKHALTVARALRDVTQKLWVFEPRPPHKDLSEHLDAGLTLRQLKRVDWEQQLAESENGKPKTVRLEVMSAEQIMALPGPKMEDMLLGPLIYRGHRLVLGGHTGHGKSTCTMHMVAAATRGSEFLEWQGRGEVRALVIDVEQGTTSVQRILREVGLDDSKAVGYLRIPDGLALDTDTHAIREMERVFRNGRYDLVLADPLYKLHRGDPNDSRAAVELMRRFDEWRERFEFALILPMHCRKPHPNSILSAHDLFGSASYQWGAEVLMGIERKSDGCSLLHWWKDREGALAEGGAAVGSHWKINYSRENGYRRIRKDPKPETFNLAKWCYEAIRDSDDGLTREEMRSMLWHDRRQVTTGQLDSALAKATMYGIAHNGMRLKKDRVYRLPNELFSADQASIEHQGAVA